MSSPIPFEPIEFYREAKSWNTPKAPEAIKRSVASRAYYAAFLSARVKAKLGKSGSTHLDTINHYGQLGGGANRLISNSLYQLHVLRKKADYDISPPFQPKFADRALNLSKAILKAFGLSP